jgi:hypothetical protein
VALAALDALVRVGRVLAVGVSAMVSSILSQCPSGAYKIGTLHGAGISCQV